MYNEIKSGMEVYVDDTNFSTSYKCKIDKLVIFQGKIQCILSRNGCFSLGHISTKITDNAIKFSIKATMWFSTKKELSGYWNKMSGMMEC